MKARTAADLLQRSIIDAQRVADYTRELVELVEQMDPDEDVPSGISLAVARVSSDMIDLRRRMEES